VRLFIAVNIPDEMRSKIWDSAAPLREQGDAIRWVEPEGMHLTLKFLGEVSVDREESVGLALEAAATGVVPFTVRFVGFGAFPSTRRPKVIWVGCESHSALQLLQRQVEERMGEIGFPNETRAFRPHLTLGRLRRHAEPSRLRGMVGLLDQLDFADEVFVPTVELMESELKPTGVTYTVRKSVELSK
jgi:2'-5' RNA ligase